MPSFNFSQNQSSTWQTHTILSKIVLMLKFSNQSGTLFLRIITISSSSARANLLSLKYWAHIFMFNLIENYHDSWDNQAKCLKFKVPKVRGIKMAVFTWFGLVFTPGLSFWQDYFRVPVSEFRNSGESETRVTGFHLFLPEHPVLIFNFQFSICNSILSKKWDFLYYQDTHRIYTWFSFHAICRCWLYRIDRVRLETYSWNHKVMRRVLCEKQYIFA